MVWIRTPYSKAGGRLVVTTVQPATSRPEVGSGGRTMVRSASNYPIFKSRVIVITERPGGRVHLELEEEGRPDSVTNYQPLLPSKPLEPRTY